MAVWIPAVTAIIIAVLGAIFGYVNSQRLNDRKARLDRVNAQLEALYGPMLAYSSANQAAWTTFRKFYRPQEVYFFAPGAKLSEADLAAWIVWMEHVFMPANRAMYNLIVGKTHLLDDDDMPPTLLEFLAHVAGYEVVLRDWAKGDYSKLTSLINHPGSEFDSYLRESFKRLKNRQQDLLGTNKGYQLGRRRDRTVIPSEPKAI
jgi:hypothetical protein